ncbi:MAG: oligosaccharide flippase family protein [Thermoflexales bacterium]|nr:oligosaccharide flippase family protein [Thermoflexales bacterium]
MSHFKNLILVRKNAILANIIWLLLASAISQGFTAASLLITARSLGPSLFGQFSACLALSRLTSIFFNLGMDTWLLRAGRTNETTFGLVIASILGIKTILGTVWLFSILFLSRFLDPATYPPVLLLVSAFTILGEATTTTISQGFNVLLKNKVTLKLSLISSTILFAGTLMIHLLLHSTPMHFMLARLLTGWMTVGLGLLWLMKISPLQVEPALLVPTLIQSFPFAISDALLIIYTQADIALVGILLDSKSAGLYSTASGLLRTAFIIPSAVFMVMTPIISQLGKQKDLPLFSKMAVKTFFALLVVGLTLWLLMRIGGPLFVRLTLQPKFAQAGAILAILSVILLFKSCSYALAAVIIATEQQAWRVVVQGVVAFTNLCLNIIVIPIYGITGASWVYVASEGLLLLGYVLVAVKGYLALRQSTAILAR